MNSYHPLGRIIVVSITLRTLLARPTHQDNSAGPPSQNVSEVRFFLFTRQNPHQEQILPFDDPTELKKSNFRKDRLTKVLVHGYDDEAKTSFLIKMKDAYLDSAPCNVILVDWSKLAGPSPFYYNCVKNCRPVGFHVGRFIRNQLVEVAGSKLADFHVIGFSLGAQMVSQIGWYLKGMLGRITGLDPAGFLFHTVPPSRKLSPGDAHFVDVIHSAGLWIGTDEPVGDADFYPNSGKAPQPGCESKDELGLLCSHLRAPAYFTESITAFTPFKATQCPSWAAFESGSCNHSQDHNLMGEPAKPWSSGLFFLKTRATPPYAIPQTLP